MKFMLVYIIAIIALLEFIALDFMLDDLTTARAQLEEVITQRDNYQAHAAPSDPAKVCPAWFFQTDLRTVRQRMCSRGGK